MVELDHIAIIVSSEDCLRFYEKLGFIIRNKINRLNDSVIFMQNGNLKLEIFVDSNHPERMQTPEAKGLRHIALNVENLDLICSMVECDEIKRDWYGRRFTFTKDPDGQPIELTERGYM